MSRPWIQGHQMDRNVGVGLTKPHKPLKSNHSTYDGMRKVKLNRDAGPAGEALSLCCYVGGSRPPGPAPRQQQTRTDPMSTLPGTPAAHWAIALTEIPSV